MSCACFLLAQARGNGVVMPNVAEKRVFGVQKTVKFDTSGGKGKSKTKEKEKGKGNGKSKGGGTMRKKTPKPKGKGKRNNSNPPTQHHRRSTSPWRKGNGRGSKN